MTKTDNRRRFIINIFYFLIIIGIGYFVLKYGLPLVMPFIIAFFIAFCLQRPIAWISKKTKMPRKIVAVILVALFYIISAGLLFTLGYQLIIELVGLLQKLPDQIKEVLPGITGSIEDGVSKIIGMMPDDWQQNIINITGDLLNSVQTRVVEFSTSAISQIGSIAASLPTFLISLIVTIVSTFFLSADYRSVVSFIRRQVPERHQELFTSVKKQFISTILRFLKAYIILMAITFVELVVLLTFWVDIDYSVTIAAIIAVVDVLPVLGTGTVLIPWALILVILGDWFMALKVATTYAVVTVVRNILEPRVVGKQIGLHPLVTLFCMFVGLQLFGFIGLLLIPVTVIIVKNIQEEGKIHIWK